MPQSTAGTIRIASKPTTEQHILGEALKLLIEQDTDLSVELTQGVGGASNIQPAMAAGKFDLYPEYTGTAWNEVLGETGVYSEDRFGELASRYADDCNQTRGPSLCLVVSAPTSSCAKEWPR